MNTTVTKTAKGEYIKVNIRLDDECKNGHQDFAITAYLYEADKPKIDKYMTGCGCMHDDILKHFPEFKIFVDLHLSDWEGIPMHAVENGFYHLTADFNDTSKPHKTIFCEYYRVSPEQYDSLKTSESKLEYALMLRDLGILSQWKKQADKAIKMLEKMTGEKFVNTSTKSQYQAPKQEDEQDFLNKKANGYFSDEQKKKRAEIKKQAKKAEILKKLDAERDQKVKIALSEYNISLLMLDKFDPDFKNWIYYTHSNTLNFNWKGFEPKLSEEQIIKFADSLTEKEMKDLPDNLIITIDSESGKDKQIRII